MSIKMILCTDKNNGIGINNTIPWYCPEDFKHFKNYTNGKTIIMGFNTWKSLPKKPLPNRYNVVVINREYKISDRSDIENLSDVLFLFESDLYNFLIDNPDSIIIGGSKLYNLCLPYVDEIAKTTIDNIFKCDTYFDIHNNKNIKFIKIKELQIASNAIVEYYKKE